MKKILLINPNSSEKMTSDIQDTVSRLNISDIAVTVVKMPDAPEVLESFVDYTVAGTEVIKYLNQLQATGKQYDGVLLACFGDPCLYALKEICQVPVIGIAECAMSIALLLGFKFSILASSTKAKPMMEATVKAYGLEARMASVETFNLPIADFVNDKEVLRNSILNSSKAAKAKGAEVLLLGCAGMTMIGDEIEALVGIPVIDPIKTGIVTLNAILDAKLSVCKTGLYM
ncbi:MAG: aspartate/glutamate racemase family protein [Eubacteriales bacterium]|nr:aspartate/glutamate racemase family protein [Eubacteriales bacterium]MDD3073165.1 aspartate/glutamate racemase family protein [Eubacteriales bacterium]MDD4079241.1 aspartate/glutamate racemase family protein [Eubacteriales bacterium]MDD4768483.1 aspartate/glutamate racemase family protein [Eubacteriales bacterium]